MIDIQEIYNRLLSQNFSERLFSSCNLRKREGKELMGNCPFCNSDRFSVSTVKPVYKCWSCNESGDWIDYLQRIENKSFMEAVLELGESAGINIEVNEKFEKSYQERKRRNSLFEEIQSFFTENLTSSHNQGFKYLQVRGYDNTLIKNMQLGYYSSTLDINNYLIDKGFTEDEIRVSGLMNPMLEGRISIPYPNQAGVLTGFAFRTCLDKNKPFNDNQSLDNNQPFNDNKSLGDNQPKYLYTKGLKKSEGLVGYQFRPYQPLRVLIVEGLIDALLLNSLGLKDYWILALGGSSLNKEQIKVIESSGVQEVLLCLDNDLAGVKGCENAINLLKDSKLRCYCFDWEDSPYKDPDELVRSEGVENFYLLLELNCRSWSKWLAHHLHDKYSLGTQLGNDGYINQCLEIEGTISDPLNKREFHDTFMENIARFNITEEDISLRKQEKLSQSSFSKSRSAINHLYKKLGEVVKQEEDINLLDTENLIEEGLTNLQKCRGVELPQPYLFSDVLLDVAKTGEGLSTGFVDLDQLCLIPRGAITLIAARPSMGKTTFMFNLLLNQIKLYPDRSFYFFSYEENKSRLAVKIIQNLSGVVISNEFNHNAYIRYLKVHRLEGKFNEQIEAGIKQFQEYVNSGRLWLLDKQYSDKDLATTIKLLSDNNNMGAVYIDYVQKIPPTNGSHQDWLNIKNVSQTILDTAVSLDIPIILGCQLNRATESQKDKRPSLGQLRQSGDLEQDANLVLGLYRDEFYNKETIDLGVIEVSTLKNRNGSTGGIAKLSFLPECLQIENSSGYARNYSHSSDDDVKLDF